MRKARARRPPASRPPASAAGTDRSGGTATSTWSSPSRKVTAFIGPSGCGKSTLLQWFNRMNDTIPTARAEGRLELGHRSPGEPLRRRGSPPPGPDGLPEAESVPEVDLRQHRLRTTATASSVLPSDLAELVEQSLRQAAIWDEVKDRLHQSALGLSGGQQQGLCIARAIAVGRRSSSWTNRVRRLD